VAAGGKGEMISLDQHMDQRQRGRALAGALPPPVVRPYQRSAANQGCAAATR
jgi:hypothetical protein